MLRGLRPGVGERPVALQKLDRGRRDNAMRWLIDNNMLEREEEAEKLLDTGEGLPDYDFGSVFRITNPGRELLEEVRERRQA